MLALLCKLIIIKLKKDSQMQPATDNRAWGMCRLVYYSPHVQKQRLRLLNPEVLLKSLSSSYSPMFDILLEAAGWPQLHRLSARS